MISSPNSYPEKVDFTNCDREPIHIIGKSQAHGVIIVCESAGFSITHCSDNIEELLGFKVSELLNNSLEKLLPVDFCERIRGVKAGEKLVLPETLIFKEEYFAIAHLSGGNYIIDLEPVGEKQNQVFFQGQLTRILNDLHTATSVSQLSQRAASLVKDLFDYDRVMLYRFDQEWNGEVVAEEKEQEMESWLGLHYPATDIPKPAREIFLKQGVRIISDVDYTPAIIVPANSVEGNSPVDLSRSELRGVSPIHIEYLQNMKVGASLTAAIILEGDLWGLLACHHNNSKFINYYQRQSMELLTQIFSNKLAVETTRFFLEKKRSSEEIRKKLVDQMKASVNFVEALLDPQNSFKDLLNASGGAIFSEGKVQLVGITPSEENVLQLVQEF